MESERNRLWRVRRTVLQMLKDRGYIVVDKDLNMTVDEFGELFGEKGQGGNIHGVGQTINREAITILSQKQVDPAAQIFVFFPSEQKIGVQPIRRYHTRMKENGVFRAIMVVPSSITPMARQAVAQLKTKNFVIEEFKEGELLVNITQHVLVPKHVPLSNEEKQALLQRYKLKPTQLPRIQVVDPVARYYGLQRGQVVKIIRPSETAGRYVTYRIVV
eukprot:GEZU01033746.1.p1 GENE.GEZU01033746.1~~GEZU01033746.1.p1  ORF type:complete len:217 (-),score=31.81 GEZU01033746.1:218-868(-)